MRQKQIIIRKHISLGMEPGLELEPENPCFHMDFGTWVFKFKTQKPEF